MDIGRSTANAEPSLISHRDPQATARFAAKESLCQAGSATIWLRKVLGADAGRTVLQKKARQHQIGTTKAPAVEEVHEFEGWSSAACEAL